MDVISFRYKSRFGHFLRAEANASWLSYPIPPRTALLGLLGAILGLEKDQPQLLLADAKLGIEGKSPQTHWHTANIRKAIPAPLSMKIKRAKSRGTKPKGAKSKGAKQIAQEWLISPNYVIYAFLPSPWQEQLEQKLKEQQCHFCPCMGLSEMIAQVSFIDSVKAEPLPQETHIVDTVIRLEEGKLEAKKIVKNQLAMKMLQMPREVSAQRDFIHANYIMERSGKSIPILTSEAWLVGSKKVMFL